MGSKRGTRHDRSFADHRDVVERLVSVDTYKRDGERAPHKALLLLIALARLQRGERREMAFSEVERQLSQLLRAFGPPRTKVGPQYPFWHLQTDGVWTLRDSDRLLTPAKSISLPALRAHGFGGLDPAIERALQEDPDSLAAVAHGLLERTFPPSLHEAVLSAVGLDVSAPGGSLSERIRETTTRRRVRDPEFRRLVLRIYEGRCAFCGYGGRLGGDPVGVEAAHIRWHACEGPDVEANGIAACDLHHTALDRGALSITPDHRILVSESFTSNEGAADAVLGLSKAPLRPPMPGHDRPAPVHVLWHYRQVFRAPERA